MTILCKEGIGESLVCLYHTKNMEVRKVTHVPCFIYLLRCNFFRCLQYRIAISMTMEMIISTKARRPILMYTVILRGWTSSVP